jgi:KaiC/GvpD/RAD55 family RecA-like ATPase
MSKQEGLTFKSHMPCPHEKCGSSDAVTIYKKLDDKGKEFLDGFCFACEGYVPPKLVETFYGEDFDGGQFNNEPVEVDELVLSKLEDILKLECRGSKQRKLRKQVNELYGVRTEFDPTGRPVKRYYPGTEDGVITGYKTRDLTVPKKDKRHFSVIGSIKNKNELFGQSLYQKGGKFLVIVGGEEDALAMKQTMVEKSPKYDTAVVSPLTGEPSLHKQILENYDWVTSFECVIIMMDNDEAGAESAEKAAKLLKPGQAYIADLRLNDPCDYVKDGLEDELYQSFWKAYNTGKYTPAGVVGSSQTFDALMERANWVKLPLPVFAKKLQDMMNGGFAFGEIINIVAASSVGKTTVVNEFLYNFIFNSTHKIGVIPLESDMGELMENLISVHMNIKLANMPDEEKRALYQSEEFAKAYKELTTLPNGEDRFIILDHQGDVCDDELKNKIEYMVKGMGCRGIILDPLTLALSGKGNDGMDEFMSWLLRFVKREKVIHINVAHVRKSGSGAQANSRGAEIHEEDIKGSGSIFQVGMINILLMRDKEHEDARVRNTTKVVVSKARRTGNTGPAGFWYYDGQTARLEETNDPEGDYSDDEGDFGTLGAYTQEHAREDNSDKY